MGVSATWFLWYSSFVTAWCMRLSESNRCKDKFEDLRRFIFVLVKRWRFHLGLNQSVPNQYTR